jgi:hypothetical protein
MSIVAFILFALGGFMDLPPVFCAARWQRLDRAPPSAIPILPWILYLAACLLWRREVPIRWLAFCALSLLHLLGQSFVARRRVHWVYRAKREDPGSPGATS